MKAHQPDRPITKIGFIGFVGYSEAARAGAIPGVFGPPSEQGEK